MIRKTGRNMMDISPVGQLWIRKFWGSVLAAAVVITLAPGQATVQTQTREQRIKEHQDRIHKILEASRKRRQEQQQLASPPAAPVAQPQSAGSHQETSSTLQANESGTPDTVDANWEELRTFYYEPQKQETKFGGREQEFSDDWIEMKWDLGEPDSKKKRSELPPRKLQYRWKYNSGSADFAAVVLPIESDTVYLRNGEQCVSFAFDSYGGSDAVVGRWRQPDDWKIISNATFPAANGFARTRDAYDMLVTPEEPQVLNDWLFHLESGTLYADNLTVYDDGQQSTETVRIGSQEDDFRPVGTMKALVRAVDASTSSVLVVVDQARYVRTVFANDWTNYKQQIEDSVMAGHRTIAAMLYRLGQHYGFSIKWADAETEALANERPFKHEWTNTAPILWDITEALKRDLVPEVLSSTSLRIGLSLNYKIMQEIPKLRERLDADFTMETKLYSTERLTASTAAALITEMLSCYAITEPTAIDTSDTLLVKGVYRSIVKRPLSQQEELKKQLENVRCESIIADAENNTLVVKATAQSHAKIAAWLQEIDGSAKKTSLGANEPAPERRRLQVVLLQGGKAGQPAITPLQLVLMQGGLPTEQNGTTASLVYDADIPAKFGMTPDDLKVMGFDGAIELGRGLVDLVANPGELGQSTLKLGGRYPVTLAYRDERSPYLIVDATLMGEKNEEPLAENTMMLEPGKPGFLGVTNLSGAVIIAVTWLNGPANGPVSAAANSM